MAHDFNEAMNIAIKSSIDEGITKELNKLADELIEQKTKEFAESLQNRKAELITKIFAKVMERYEVMGSEMIIKIDLPRN